jgi:hypothetical protein
MIDGVDMMPTVCPDCHQPLSEPAEPCGYLGNWPVWCATCEGCHDGGRVTDQPIDSDRK